MLASTKTVSIVLLWTWCFCCCCYGPVSCSVEETKKLRHARTRSGSARHQRTKGLTADMPVVSTVAGPAPGAAAARAGADERSPSSERVPSGEENIGSVLGDYLIRKPTNVVRSLLQTGVSVVQSGMDAYGHVSNGVFGVVRKTTGIERGRRIAAATESDSGYSRMLGQSVMNMIGTGLTGMEQITDLSLLLGNMGAEKIKSGLDGKDGNREIYKMLVKYVGSRIGMGTKGSVVQFIDDIGTISTFVAKDEEIIIAISTVMERLLSNPDVCEAMVRLGITMLESSPSTSCLLDQLPLSAGDIRMVFDVFVGSEGQKMLSTIASLLSEMTTGPDTKAFLESLLGMMSMFKSSTGDDQNSEESKKPTTIFSSLTNFFTGGDNDYDDDDDDDDDYRRATTPPLSKPKKPKATEMGKTKIQSKKNGTGGITAKPHSTHNNMMITKDDDSWFGATSTAAAKIPSADIMKMSAEDETWFSSGDGLGGTANGGKTGSKTGAGKRNGRSVITADMGGGGLSGETKKAKNRQRKSRTKSGSKTSAKKRGSRATKSGKNNGSIGVNRRESHGGRHRGRHRENHRGNHSDSDSMNNDH